MEKTHFTHGDVLNIFPNIKGISLIKWAERGLIEPLYEPPNSGGKRLYSYRNLIEIGFIYELTILGITSPWIKHEILAEPRVKYCFDKEHFTGIFVQYWRMPRKLEEEQYDNKASKQHSREPIGGLYVGSDRKQLSIENTISYLVVNLDQLKKEIDLRLVQEGWK